MRVVSLFAGIGGFDLTFKKHGHEIVYANEWDKYAAKVYEKNFNHRPDTTDIRQVDAESIPKHDIICAGFPCQAFTIQGKRFGFDDTRGTFFYEIMRIAKHHGTKYLLLENVKGLLSHDKGRTFAVILASLDELGYNAEWQVLNSKHFGVPQNRERIFIIGHLRSEAFTQIFPIKKTDIEFNQKNTEIKQLNKPKFYNDRFYDKSGLAPTLNTMQGGNKIPKILSHSPRTGDPTKGGTGALISSEYSFTIDRTPHSVIEGEGMKIRRLTPLECERLQAFPDKWTEGISDSQRYKCLGNAVTVNVVEEIVKKLTEVLK